jgi:hypothetical protein
MKTLMALAVVAVSVITASAQTQGRVMSLEDMKEEFRQANLASERAYAQKEAELAAMRAERLKLKEANDTAYQLLQLRIETAYPNDPAMWRALNRTSEANRKRYLGE